MGVALKGGKTSALVMTWAAASAAASAQSPITAFTIDNPFEREIVLSVPFSSNGVELGEVTILMNREGELSVDAPSLRPYLADLVKPDIENRIIERFGDEGFIRLSELADEGVAIEFNLSLLEATALIAPTASVTRNLAFGAQPSRVLGAGSVQPTRFSSFLNITSTATEGSGSSITEPNFFFSGATRYRGTVLEYDGSVTRGFGASNDYEFTRRFVRLVRDDSDRFLRYSAGDIFPEVRGFQASTTIGGVSLVRSRREFTPFRSFRPQGGGQILLDRAADISVLVNDTEVRSLRLAPGSYNITDLPLRFGTSDVEILIEDDTGRRDVLEYQTFFDPSELDPGDHEFGVTAGFLAEPGLRQLSYDFGQPAVSAFYRRANYRGAIYGAGVQASADQQLVNAMWRIVPRFGGRLDLEGAVSNTSDGGFGYAARASYDYFRQTATVDESYSVAIETTSRRFAPLGQFGVDNDQSFSAFADYSRSFGRRWRATIGGSYTAARAREDTFRASFDTFYQFSRRLRFQAGVSYQRSGLSLEEEFGVRVGLTFTPGRRWSSEARYESFDERASLRVARSQDDLVGSFGVDADVVSTKSELTAGGAVNYVANRFEARLSHSLAGDSFDSITDVSQTTFRASSSLALAGRSFGVGRPIFDSFAVFKPHKTLDGRSVIAGSDLSEGYEGRSGVLGGAVVSQLSSFAPQTLAYDVSNVPAGYDIGDGVVGVVPPLNSGYAVEVGSAGFISATGTLLSVSGAPVPLGVGRVISVDGEELDNSGFFTNRAGRFALIGLEPDTTYRVELSFPSATNFTIKTPDDDEALLRLGDIAVDITLPEDTQ